MGDYCRSESMRATHGLAETGGFWPFLLLPLIIDGFANTSPKNQKRPPVEAITLGFEGMTGWHVVRFSGHSRPKNSVNFKSGFSDNAARSENSGPQECRWPRCPQTARRVGLVTSATCSRVPTGRMGHLAEHRGCD